MGKTFGVFCCNCLILGFGLLWGVGPSIYAETNEHEIGDANGFAETRIVKDAYQYLNQEKYDLALESFNKALEQEGTSYEALLGRGRTYYQLNQLSQAFEDASQAIKLVPRIPFAYLLRASVYDDWGQFSNANADLTHAIALNPSMGQLYTSRAVGLIKLGKPEDALLDLVKAEQLDGKNIHIHFLRGRAYTELGRFQQAILAYTHALELDPDDSLSLINRGSLYRCIGQSQNAIDDTTRLLSLEPNKMRAYIERAYANIQLEQFDQALEDVTYVLKHGNIDTEVYLSLASIYDSKGQLAKALEANQKAINQDTHSEFPYAYFQRGIYLLDLKQFHEAELAFQKGLGLAAKSNDYQTIQDGLADLEEFLAMGEKKVGQAVQVAKKIQKDLKNAQALLDEPRTSMRGCVR